MDKVTTVTTQPSVTSQHLVTSLSSRSPVTLVASQSSVSSQSVVTSQPLKDSAIPESDFLNLSFEQLNQVEVQSHSSNNYAIRIESQQAGEVTSKPVEFLNMSFEQLAHLPVRVATLSEQEKAKEKKLAEKPPSSPTVENLPNVLTKQSLNIKLSIRGEVHSIEKNLADDKTTAIDEDSSDPPTYLAPVPPPLIALPQFLVTADNIGDTLSILRRNINGSFTLQQQIAINSPNDVVVADLNRDGLLDIVAISQSGALVVTLGAGRGTFSAPISQNAGPGFQGIAVGDFNGDNIPDLALVRLNNIISVRLGNGDGTFGGSTSFFYGGGSRHIVTADFNGDGVLDLAITNEDFNTLNVLLGTGTGAFGSASSMPIGVFPWGIIAADFNKDGIVDLAVTSLTDGTVGILRGTGLGTFEPAVYFAVGSGPTGIDIGDFNLDGKLDIVVSNRDSNSISVLLGTGTGSFAPINTFAAGMSPSDVVVGDYDGDGIPDLAVTNEGTNDVSIFLGNGDGTFRPSAIYAVGEDPIVIGVGIFSAAMLAGLLPAGISGNPINLALLNPSPNPESISLTIKGIPVGWALNAGVNNFDGSWTIETAHPESLMISTTPDFIGSKMLSIDMSWIASDGNIADAQFRECVTAYAPGSAIFALPGDNLTGSIYEDKFVIRKSEAGVQDKIFNFDSDFDVINLMDFSETLQFSDLQISNDLNGSAVVSINSGEHSIVVNNLKAESLNASHFLFDVLPHTVNHNKIEVGIDSIMPFGGVLENNGIIEVEGRLVMHGDITGSGKIIIGHSGSVEVKGHINQDIIFETGSQPIVLDHFDISLASLTRISLETIFECYPALI